MNTNEQGLRELLEKANNALEKAMIICNAVPSNAHQNGVNEPLKHIGRLVNNGDDCFFYFRDIRESQKEVKEALNNMDEQAVAHTDANVKDTIEEIADTKFDYSVDENKYLVSLEELQDLLKATIEKHAAEIKALRGIAIKPDSIERLEELGRALSAIRVVGQIDGHDVIRRESVINIARDRVQKASAK